MSKNKCDFCDKFCGNKWCYVNDIRKDKESVQEENDWRNQADGVIDYDMD